jgi:hypothetical protein
MDKVSAIVNSPIGAAALGAGIALVALNLAQLGFERGKNWLDARKAAKTA